MVPFPQHRTALAAIVTGLVTILAAGRALSQEPIPALDLDDPQKAVVVELHFTDFSTVEVEDTDVVFGVPPALLGNPPLLGVKIFDLEGGVVEAFDTWHPLYSFTETEDGGEELELLDGASAPVTFPLRPDVATMEVTDLETEEILISVDLIPAVHRFCREERDDPDCQDIANRPPICRAGGPYRAECAGPSTPVSITLDGTGSEDPDQDPLSFVWTRARDGMTSNDVSPSFQFTGLGFENVNLTVEDDRQAADMCMALISLEDTVPPEFTLEVSRRVPSPANRREIPVLVQVNVTDACDPAPVCRITDVTSTGQARGQGADWQITGNLSLTLRAGSDRTRGRTYVIEVECSDASGNTTTKTASIVVPSKS